LLGVDDGLFFIGVGFIFGCCVGLIMVCLIGLWVDLIRLIVIKMNIIL
jgi:hypothetical protein